MNRRWTDPRIIVPALVTVLVLAGGIVLYRAAQHGTRITAVFPRVVGLYAGDDVRILGVRVGQVDRITPGPDGVRVELTLQDGVSVPASAQLVIVAPSLVSGRYVQVTPAWTAGPRMQDGAVVDASRTSVPVEWDELKSALDTFTKDLGPDSPDGSSPLGRAATASDNLDGKGTSINGTIEELSSAMDVLSRSRGDLFGTVTNLAKFTGTLRESDQQIRLFADQINTMTELLAGNRKDLAGSLEGLRKLMPELQSYLKEDGPLLQQNLAGLRTASDLIAGHRQDLGDLLQTAPVSLSNVQLFYDAKTRSTTGAIVFPYVQGPTQIVCFLISRVVSDPGVCSGLLKLFPFLDPSNPAAAQASAPGDVSTLLTYGSAKAKGARMIRLARLVVAALGAVLVSGCSAGLPFAAGTGSDGYQIYVELSDAHNLVRNAEVKVADVTVGSVTRIQLSGWHADLTVRLDPSVRLPADAQARVATKSLLGAQYLELTSPDKPADTKLAPGSVIPLARTGAYPETEDLLIALSTLLNGGGLGQIRTITTELNRALDGRAPDVRQLLERLQRITRTLDGQRDEIITLLDRLDDLSTTLVEQGTTVRRALPELAPGLEALQSQRVQLNRTLRTVSDLNTVLTPVLSRYQGSLVTEVRNLQPVLKGIADAGDDIVPALDMLPTLLYPVSTIRTTVLGDYQNLFPNLNLKSAELLKSFGIGTAAVPTAGGNGSTAAPPSMAQLFAPTTRKASP